MSASPDRTPGGGPGGGESPPPPDRLDFASLSLSQPGKGYRFTVDSVLLARFAAPLCAPAVLDLGTGSGIVLLLLGRLCPVLVRGVGVELQEELFRHAASNFERNAPPGRLRAVHGDLRERVPGEDDGSFGLVVSNPPFRPVGTGRRNPDAQREIARHEVACTLPDLFLAASRNLGEGGRLALVFPAARSAELLRVGEEARFRPDRLRFVHPFAGREASRVLASFRKGGRRGDVTVMAPLVEYAAPGRYHPDVEEAFGGLVRK